MCKILGLTNLKNVEVNYELLKVLKEVTCINQNHGFGYAVHNDYGKFGEMYLDPKDFKRMEMLFHYDRLDQEFLTPEIDFCYTGKEVYQPTNNKSLIMHGRTATNNKFLENTHPFFSENGDAFVHNGVIHNKNIWDYPVTSNNDSEILANMFWNGGINHVADNTDGYYAFMNIDKDGILHIVKDNTANLHMSYIREIDSYIITTLSGMITMVCKKMGWIEPSISVIDECCYIKMDGNDFINVEWFDKKKKVTQLTDYQKRAFRDQKDKNVIPVDYSYAYCDIDDISDEEWENEFGDFTEEDWLAYDEKMRLKYGNDY